MKTHRTLKAPSRQYGVPADWSLIHGLAVDIANASASGRSTQALYRRVRAALERIERYEGVSASLLATRADYTVNPKSKLSLLTAGYRLASRKRDVDNRIWIAHSIARVAIEERHDLKLGRRWCSVLARALKLKPSRYEARELRRLRRLATRE